MDRRLLMSMKVADVPAEYIMSAAEAVFYTRPEYDLAAVAMYLRTTDHTANDALQAAETLGYVRRSAGGSFEANEELLGQLTHADLSSRRALFHMALARFEPFQRFKERIYCGDSPLEAATKVKALYDIENEAVPLKELFQRWGLFGNAFVLDPLGNLVVPEKSQSKSLVSSVKASIRSRDDARSFMQTRLSPDHFNYLPVETIDNYSSALTRISDDHKPVQEIVFPMGLGFEKFIEKVASDANPPVDLTGAAGIGQMLDRLRTANIITRKHRGMAEPVAAIRNAADHGIDNEINAAWTISPDTVLAVALVSLDTMRSVLEWFRNQRPEL